MSSWELFPATISQQTIACSKLTIETEKGMKYVQG